ncbi:Uncharacterised protein [uncultured archaeon]|nr:Uncharacterised protein [uncultured archaeon]
MTISDIHIQLSLSNKLALHIMERATERLRLLPRPSCWEDSHKSEIITGNAF